MMIEREELAAWPCGFLGMESGKRRFRFNNFLLTKLDAIKNRKVNIRHLLAQKYEHEK
jgi:hypothetical protein